MSARPTIDPKKAELSQLATNAANAYKRGEYLSAIDLYKQLDLKAPRQALVQYNLGTLYLEAKDPYTALEYYKKAVDLKPGEARYVAAFQKLMATMQKSESDAQQSSLAWSQAGYPQNQGQAVPPQQPQAITSQSLPTANTTAAQLPKSNSANFSTTPQSGTILSSASVPGQSIQLSTYAQQTQSPPAGFLPPQEYAADNQSTTKPKADSGKKSRSTQTSQSISPRSLAKGQSTSNSLKVAPPDAAATYGIIAGATGAGVVISTVGIGSRASKAGLRIGDIIRAVDGKVIKSVDELNEWLSQKNGAAVTLFVQRGQLMGQVNLN
jgi:tetratricopeptide (TPR) repeat protein